MRRVVVPVLAVFLALMLGGTSLAAQKAVQRVWSANVGSGGLHGHETLTGFTDGMGQVSLELAGMRANATYYPQVYGGTCSQLGNLAVRWASLRTDASGAASSVRAVSRTTMNKIWHYARPGSIAIRFVSGSSSICADLTYVHATRVSVPNYSIDLPVVAGPSGYPYCNVAMYQKVLWQPAEPGVTFIFAHARTGMFLPLLTASKINNGAGMIGKLVYVYTSDSKMYTYKIKQVRRHVTSVQSSVGITSAHLWLQTSEGSNFTYPKLVIVADRIAVQSVSYATSHPAPHIVHCG